MLERYGHGGDLRTAQELFGLPADQFHDFSANMNPYGPPACVAEVLRTYTDSIDRYPDPSVRELRRKLGIHHDLDPSCVLVGNGAAELIDLAVRVYRPEVTAVTGPSFVEYADAARKCGSPIHVLPLYPENDFRLTADTIRRALLDFRRRGIQPGQALWFLGSPNNPTGQLVEPAIIRELLLEGERVIVDEAFMDFVPDAANYSLLREAEVNERLTVIRSMTKFYAIPGIRLGYAAGSPQTIAELGRLQVPWSVNSLSQQIGSAVLDEKQYAENTLTWLKQERPWLESQLSALGLRVYPGEVNYILFSIPAEFNLTSKELQHEMGVRGVLIRDASGFDGLDETFCRIAVRFREEHLRLLDVMKNVLADPSRP
ncbi:pyridoxal phosphate-dependent aminotransferase [Paenibacillus spongiae]|uniref:Aminotransferase n=1 Tax=Paenibacillus spongiae TaxID=2909671 RepID=A0ABY5SGB4_9BACL|nr:threonine-phosphate decarboxylase [Paenibacillus spongiae]UVI32603.1 aminotransferase class I/II-fold pyridoxal phosphate-dependent enzyme [Paenibacillus spongiae]